MFCIVNNIVIGIAHNIVVSLTILVTIQNIVLSYCHIVIIVAILDILSCIVNNIARVWFADADKLEMPLPVPSSETPAGGGPSQTRPLVAVMVR